MNDEELNDANQAIEETKGSVITTQGLGIQGLEDVPASILPVPWLRLVQLTSQKIETDQGKEAPAGSFFYNDTKESTQTVKFALIRAKHGVQNFERNGEVVLTTRLAILGYDLLVKKVFVMTLSVMSFNNFGTIINKFKQLGVTKSWEYEIEAIGERQENEKGKYYIANFKLGKKISPEVISQIESEYLGFGVVLDRNNPETLNVEEEV